MTTIFKWLEWVDAGPPGNHYPGEIITVMIQRHHNKLEKQKGYVWLTTLN